MKKRLKKAIDKIDATMRARYGDDFLAVGVADAGEEVEVVLYFRRMPVVPVDTSDVDVFDWGVIKSIGTKVVGKVKPL